MPFLGALPLASAISHWTRSDRHYWVGALISSSDRDFPPIETMPKPVLVFDPSSARKDDWSERGLKASGPYDQRTFSPKKLNIAVICQAKHEGQVDRFVAKFLDGMPKRFGSDKLVERYGFYNPPDASRCSAKSADCAQTEQHHELQSGIEQLNGVTAAIILSRPSHMKRKNRKLIAFVPT
jgi:hypothetical protein